MSSTTSQQLHDDLVLEHDLIRQEQNKLIHGGGGTNIFRVFDDFMIDSIFSDQVYIEKIALTPSELDENLHKTILQKLRDKLEGKCNHDGFIRRNSCQILSRSLGRMDDASFTGNFIFTVTVKCSVCRPSNGQIMSGRVLQKNKMGLYIIINDPMIPATINISRTSPSDILRVIIPRDLHSQFIQQFDNIEIGEIVSFQINGHKFGLNSDYINAIGELILNDTQIVEDIIRGGNALASAAAATEIETPKSEPKRNILKSIGATVKSTDGTTIENNTNETDNITPDAPRRGRRGRAPGNGAAAASRLKRAN